MNLIYRPRRLRRTSAIRAILRETEVRPADLIYPYFVKSGVGQRLPIASMPGVSRFSVDAFLEDLAESVAMGIQAILLFGVPDLKDPEGKGAWDEDGPVPAAVRAAKDRFPELVVMADVCLCEYTDHGHCGPVESGTAANDHACAGYAKAAVAYARAGADFVAPSGMMDGMVEVIRTALDAAGHSETSIMAYSVKYASHLYGPFRDAAGSPPKFGDRRGYQMDPANIREAFREAELDVAEGADILMVKPALHCLDVIAQLRSRFDLPLAAYHVSGEYSMAHAAIERGWATSAALDEALLAIKRAGADLVISYHAKEYLRVHGNRR